MISRRALPAIISLASGLLFLMGWLSVANGQALVSNWLSQYTPRYVAPTGSDLSNDCAISGSPCATIQHAVDEAAAGDEIRVAAGTYSGVQVYTPSLGVSQTQVVYIDKDLAIRGGYTTTDWDNQDPAGHPTIIDAQGQGRPVTVFGPNWNQVVTLAGMTLTGGDYTGLGNPDGESNAICSGSGNDCGGGLYVYLSAIHLADMVITGNIASQDAGVGGGIYMKSPGGGSIQRTVIRDNAAADQGGGLAFRDLFLPFTISGSRFESNQAGAGGGIFVRNGIQSLLTVQETSFISNTALTGNGGAASIRLVANGPVLAMDRVTFSGNRAGDLGKALHIHGAGGDAPTARLTNLLLAGNGHVPGQPIDPFQALISIDTSSPATMTLGLAHVTAADNDVDTFLFAKAYESDDQYPTTVFLTNTLLSGFTYGFAAEEGSGRTTLTDDHTLYHQVTTQTHIVGGSPAVSSLNPLSGDPKLTAAYHLDRESDAIDAGVDAGVSVDIDGDARPYGAGFDIGADELFLRFVYLPITMRK